MKRSHYVACEAQPFGDLSRFAYTGRGRASDPDVTKRPVPNTTSPFAAAAHKFLSTTEAAHEFVSTEPYAKPATQAPRVQVDAQSEPDTDADVESRVEAECLKMEGPQDETEQLEAIRLRNKLHKEGSPIAYAEVVALRQAVPELCNQFKDEASTAQVWKALDEMFLTMSPSRYSSGVGGLARYYEKHPTKTGYRPIGAPHNRLAQLDHALAKHLNCCTNHPRFYVVLPSVINTVLSSKPISARRPFGLAPSAVRAMANDVKQIHAIMKRRNMFKVIFTELDGLRMLEG
jgi:hypothetical protein